MDIHYLNTRAWAGIALAFAGMALNFSAGAAPLLRCQVTYAGTTQTIEATPVADPYPVPSVDIGGRFRFKAVMVGSAQRVDYIKLYAYLETRRQPVLVQAAKYLPPYPPAVPPATAVLLTGEQYLYAGAVERELIYRCTLEGVS
jgi:hypothetical protein